MFGEVLIMVRDRKGALGLVVNEPSEWRNLPSCIQRSKLIYNYRYSDQQSAPGSWLLNRPSPGVGTWYLPEILNQMPVEEIP